ncbi:MAG: hypothetical protein ACKV1O_07165 [Saprospiraceae bacterium]
MIKRQKKSIIDLMNKTAPESKILEEAVNKIHNIKPAMELKGKTVRVTIDTPEAMHKELKKLIIDQDMDLKSFFLNAVKEKCDKLGLKLDLKY